MDAILPVLLLPPIAWAWTMAVGLVAMWVLRTYSRSREPAFAGFCFTLGAVLFDGDRIATGDSVAEQSAAAVALLAMILALWLLWRRRVRPERSEADDRS